MVRNARHEALQADLAEAQAQSAAQCARLQVMITCLCSRLVPLQCPVMRLHILAKLPLDQSLLTSSLMHVLLPLDRK